MICFILKNPLILIQTNGSVKDLEKALSFGFQH